MPRASTPPAPGPVVPRRRTVLRAGLGAGLALPLAAGCGPADEARPAAERAEVAVLVGAVAAEQDIIALYEAARAARVLPAARLEAILGRHREHLAALRRLYVPGSGTRARALPSATPRTAPARSRLLAELRAAEAKAARDRLAEVAKADPGLAQVLASIGACEAGHAAALELV
ncbi:hypothetical protein [Actinomadura atramentaria]|uniref:hypothetical protein n=1 Tax=Actinomadura atramentaria TaxID=1990 RepID=UPI0012F76ACB|nr:hypothetical protein [Actinomadura atramentaria]